MVLHLRQGEMADRSPALERGQDPELEHRERERERERGFFGGLNLSHTCSTSSKRGASSNSSGVSDNPCTIF